MAKAELEAAVAALGLSVEAEFVPWSMSRSFREKREDGWKITVRDKNLNWKVTLKLREGRPILTTDYSAGLAHCPAYKNRRDRGNSWDFISMADEESIEYEVERGLEHRGGRSSGKPPILPDPLDFIHSLISDADVLQYATFEDWAMEFGYDADSRKAEQIYRACMDIALKLRAAIGEAGMEQLRKAGEDY